MTYTIVKRPEYRAAGLRWEGAYVEVPQLKEMIHTLRNRAHELGKSGESNMQLGLSFHVRPDGFLHYSAYEVGRDQKVPDDMIEIIIPEMTYVTAKHHRGEDIGLTYHKIDLWLKESDYKPFTDASVEYFDVLPIKHETYPPDRDESDPHFDIFIPVEKK
ncbi:GyrI-like domain-containing protein [Bacillus sp. KH172YL63]|uniref:GyrI-like domain-containing protein n=1 Tax=Bacillus sp. KH172YL63 TaxID=2709784 RepID=UPI0015660724|nr:GyrI-like domain-containing protein [Bacillus sp. KH172YL63]